MSNATRYSLFFVKNDPHFPEGTLVELEDNVVSVASLDPTSGQSFNTIPDNDYDSMGYPLPDRGDGIPGFIEKDDVVPVRRSPRTFRQESVR